MPDTDFRVKNGLVANNNLVYSPTANNLYHGNSTVNSSINSTSVAVRSPTATVVVNPTFISISTSTSTQNLTASTWSVGNATANVSGNSTSVTYANSTTSMTLSIGDILIGNSTVNAHANSTLISINSASIGIRLSDHDAFFGNSVTNATISSTSFVIGNTSAATVTIVPGRITVGNSTTNTSSNSTNLTAANTTLSTSIGVGTWSVGNSSSNVSSNSTAVLIGGHTVAANIATGFGLTGGPLVVGSNVSISTTQPPAGYDMPINLGLKVSIGSSILTTTLTDALGNSPSATNPVLIPFRSSNTQVGNVQWTSVTANVVLATTNSGLDYGLGGLVKPYRLWICAHLNTSNGQVTISHVRTSDLTYRGVKCLNEALVVGTQTINQGAPAAGTIGVFYTTAAQTSTVFRIIGYMDFYNGVTPAGSYSVLPDVVQLMGPGVKRPGDSVQAIASGTGAGTSTTSSGFVSTNLAASITLTSPVNPVLVWMSGSVEVQGGGTIAEAAIVRNAAAQVSWPTAAYIDTSGGVIIGGSSTQCFDIPATNGALTHTYRGYVKADGSGHTASFPVGGGDIMIQELMG